MPWIKRNLFFVLSMLVGLGLTGWAAYDFYSISDKNKAVADELTTTRDQLKTLKSKTPLPTSENIQAAKEDKKRVEQVLARFGAAFTPFATPPKTDEKGFKTVLETTIEQLRLQATNADVALPHDFYFSFSSQMEKLSYHAESIEPWMAQLEEIKAICGILFGARIAALDGIQRVPVSDDDQGSTDYIMGANTMSNQLGSVTPYKMTFRGYSEEIADVLEGFARSPHCWVIKDVDVRPSMASLPVVMPADLSQPAQPQPMFNRPNYDPRMDPRYRFGPGGGGRPVPAGAGFGVDRPYMPRMMPSPQYAPPPQAAAGPVTILSPKILFVTISVDLVKLKQPEVETNKPPARPAANPRVARMAQPAP